MLYNEKQEDYNFINNIRVRSFRSHNDLEISPGKSSVLIVGSNGVGKTSILEAISIFSYGKGIRNAKFFEMIKKNKMAFNVDIKLQTTNEFVLEYKTSYHKENKTRKVFINDKEVAANYIRKNIPMLWIAPYTEKIFVGASTLRRNFIDRLVNIFDSEHSIRLNEYEKNLKQRSNLLKEKNYDNIWINSIENNLSKLSVSICSSRLEIVERISYYLKKPIESFPKVKLFFSDSIENDLYHYPALDIEETLHKNYSLNRNIDALIGGSKVGCHKSDLIIENIDKGLSASLCSSGEQKSLLITIILAAASAFKKYSKKSPIILLDEVFTHLDYEKKSSLLNKLTELESQIWITATEKEKFFQNNKNFCYHYLTKQSENA